MFLRADLALPLWCLVAEYGYVQVRIAAKLWKQRMTGGFLGNPQET